MLCNRIKQFREYNNLDATVLADVLSIDVAEYESYENGKTVPTIDIVTKLAECYKVTVDEFYGYTPRLTLHTKDFEDFDDDNVDEKTLKMSDLSWDEAQLILHYRSLDDKDELISQIIKKNFKKED